MDKSAILKSLLVSSLLTAVFLSIIGGYSTSTAPDGITTHHYTFRWFKTWLFFLGIVVVPLTFILGYPASLILYKLRAFNIIVVPIVGSALAVLAVAVLFSMYPPDPRLMLYYGLGGFVCSITTFIAYKNITRP
ncbi:hypothetical protein [Microbulbifer agarilyticus]